MFYPTDFEQAHPLMCWLGDKFRARRLQEFIQRVGLTPGTRILDVGGTPDFWQAIPSYQITSLNIMEMPSRHAHVRSLVYDGLRLPFPDQAFPVVFSNSVIEHVADQAGFAREIGRVGQAYWVQVPYRYFPFEPHVRFPFYTLFPMPVKRWLARHWRYALFPREDLLTIRLLTARQLQRLFPGCEVYRERLGGMTKSLCAYRPLVPRHRGASW